MTRRTQPVEVNTFVAGLVTDASPLTFPDNASLSEENMVLNRDGSRQRRLGMNYEENYTIIDSGQANVTTAEIGRSSYKWENAGGDANKSLLAVQFGQRLDIFDLDSIPISDGLVDSFNFSVDVTNNFAYAEIDGFLVVATGSAEVTILTYDGSTIAQTSNRIKVRDLFGVEDTFSGEDLYSGSGVQTRPSSLSQSHRYNLKNQGWAVPRIQGNTESQNDPIAIFLTATRNTSNVFPSNSDLISEGIYADPNDSDNRIINRLFADEIYDNPIGSTRAPLGHYIIDLLERGSSRIEEWDKSKDRYPVLKYEVTNLPEDSTPGGINVVTEFAGRAWFAGFSGELVDGDKRSPRLSSYITFSRLVESPEDIPRCYQEADPTSINQNDLVDTDGGFVRIDGAFGITELVNIGTKLVVLAQNGVWILEGGSDYGFSATAYKVSRISEHGCRSKNSVVVVDNTVMYWGDDGIYHVTPNDFGDVVVQSLTQNRIQRLYDTIAIENKSIASGYYDTYERKIRWVYNTSLNSDDEVMELVLDVNLQAFYLNRIKQVNGYENKPVVVVEGNSYVTSLSEETVIVGADTVLANTETVVLDLGGRQSITRELVYVTVVQSSSTITYTFSTYYDTDFIDWKSSDSVGTDADAFLITGYLSGGDFYRDKLVKYLQCYLEQTEQLVEESGDDFSLINPSSCRVQAQWNWADSPNSGRWGTEFEAYRLKRHYMLDSAASPFDTGNSVVVSKSKLRGYGKVLSIKYRTKPAHDFKLHGWSMLLSMEER